MKHINAWSQWDRQCWRTRKYLEEIWISSTHEISVQCRKIEMPWWAHQKTLHSISTPNLITSTQNNEYRREMLLLATYHNVASNLAIFRYLARLLHVSSSIVPERRRSEETLGLPMNPPRMITAVSGRSVWSITLIRPPSLMICRVIKKGGYGVPYNTLSILLTVA